MNPKRIFETVEKNVQNYGAQSFDWNRNVILKSFPGNQLDSLLARDILQSYISDPEGTIPPGVVQELILHQRKLVEKFFMRKLGAEHLILELLRILRNNGYSPEKLKRVIERYYTQHRTADNAVLSRIRNTLLSYCEDPHHYEKAKAFLNNPHAVGGEEAAHMELKSIENLYLEIDGILQNRDHYISADKNGNVDWNTGIFYVRSLQEIDQERLTSLMECNSEMIEKLHSLRDTLDEVSSLLQKEASKGRHNKHNMSHILSAVKNIETSLFKTGFLQNNTSIIELFENENQYLKKIHDASLQQKNIDLIQNRFFNIETQISERFEITNKKVFLNNPLFESVSHNIDLIERYVRSDRLKQILHSAPNIQERIRDRNGKGSFLTKTALGCLIGVFVIVGTGCVVSLDSSSTGTHVQQEHTRDMLSTQGSTLMDKHLKHQVHQFVKTQNQKVFEREFSTNQALVLEALAKGSLKQLHVWKRLFAYIDSGNDFTSAQVRVLRGLSLGPVKNAEIWDKVFAYIASGRDFTRHQAWVLEGLGKAQVKDAAIWKKVFDYIDSGKEFTRNQALVLLGLGQDYVDNVELWNRALDYINSGRDFTGGQERILSRLGKTRIENVRPLNQITNSHVWDTFLYEYRTTPVVHVNDHGSQVRFDTDVFFLNEIYSTFEKERWINELIDVSIDSFIYYVNELHNDSEERRFKPLREANLRTLYILLSHGAENYNSTYQNALALFQERIGVKSMFKVIKRLDPQMNYYSPFIQGLLNFNRLDVLLKDMDEKQKSRFFEDFLHRFKKNDNNLDAAFYLAPFVSNLKKSSISLEHKKRFLRNALRLYQKLTSKKKDILGIILADNLELVDNNLEIKKDVRQQLEEYRTRYSPDGAAYPQWFASDYYTQHKQIYFKQYFYTDPDGKRSFNAFIDSLGKDVMPFFINEPGKETPSHVPIKQGAAEEGGSELFVQKEGGGAPMGEVPTRVPINYETVRENGGTVVLKKQIGEAVLCYELEIIDTKSEVAPEQIKRELTSEKYVSIIHRGHSYHLKKTFNLKYDKESLDIPFKKLLGLGSCNSFRGTEDIYRNTGRKTEFFATQGTGTLTINNPLIQSIAEKVVETHGRISWSQLHDYLKRNVYNISAEGEDYFDPSDLVMKVLLCLEEE